MTDAAGYVRFKGSVRAPDQRALFHEAFTQSFLNLDFDRLDPDFEMLFEARQLPGVTIARGVTGENRALTRDGARGTDHLALSWLVRGAGQITQRGVALPSDVMVLFDCADEVCGESGDDAAHRNVRIDRDRLLALAPHAEDLIGQPIALDQPAVALLTAYLDGLHWPALGQDPLFDQMVAQHAIDLAALIVGASGDARVAAIEGGGRAAQLAAIRRWTRARLGDPDLSVLAAARASGLCERAVQKLFADHEHRTFTQFVRDERLALARRRLGDPGWAGRPISAVAYASGFSDLSYFNRAFRAAFGCCPTEARALAAERAFA